MGDSLIVEVKHLYKKYGHQLVLRDVSMGVAKGEMVALTGRSGSGKSTLLHIIGGIDCEFQGSVRSCDQDLARLSDAELSHFRSVNVGFVFQSFYLLEHLTCLENVMLPNVFSKHPLATKEAAQRAEETLSQVGISEVLHTRPSELSGGQKQRVAIARALFHRPQLLLCDEPTGNLDSTTAMQVIDLFQGLVREGLTCLLVTHDERISMRADRIFTLSDGSIIS